MKLTQQLIKELFFYNRETGRLCRRFYSSADNPDEIKDRVYPNGDKFVYVIDKLYSIRVIIWLYVTGELVTKGVYLINSNRRDMKWQNLTTEKNEGYRSYMVGHANNKSGCVGVHWDKKNRKWVSQITRNKRRLYLGGFDTQIEAVATRKIAEIMFT